MISRGTAEKIRFAILALLPFLDDITACDIVELFPTLKENGKLILAGTRINWKGSLKRASVDLWDTTENNPDNAPTLWEDILYKNGYRIIPEVITAALAFSKGEKGWWVDSVYESLYEANVWTPVQFPAGWKKIES